MTDELVAAVCESLRKGNYVETAAACAGITARSLRAWMAKGHDARKRKVTNRYRRFLDAVERAQAEGESQHVEAIVEARSEHWQASAWWLERTRPERFGRRDKVLVENTVREELDHALTMLEQRLKPEEYDRVLAALSDGEPRVGSSDAAASLDELSDPL